MEKTYSKPKTPKHKAAKLKNLPGDTGIPFFGHVLKFIRDPFKLFAERREKYGDIFKIRVLGLDNLVIMGQPANKFVLVEQAKYFSSQLAWETNLSELFPGGLMLKDGDEHKYHRGILQSAFKKGPMSDYLEEMIPVIESFFEGWKGKTQAEVFPEIKELTLYIAGKVFFGLDFSNDLKQVNKAIMDIVKASTTPIPFPIPFTTYWQGYAWAQNFGKILYGGASGAKKKS